MCVCQASATARSLGDVDGLSAACSRSRLRLSNSNSPPLHSGSQRALEQKQSEPVSYAALLHTAFTSLSLHEKCALSLVARRSDDVVGAAAAAAAFSASAGAALDATALEAVRETPQLGDSRDHDQGGAPPPPPHQDSSGATTPPVKIEPDGDAAMQDSPASSLYIYCDSPAPLDRCVDAQADAMMTDERASPGRHRAPSSSISVISDSDKESLDVAMSLMGAHELRELTPA